MLRQVYHESWVLQKHPPVSAYQALRCSTLRLTHQWWAPFELWPCWSQRWVQSYNLNASDHTPPMSAAIIWALLLLRVETIRHEDQTEIRTMPVQSGMVEPR